MSNETPNFVSNPKTRSKKRIDPGVGDAKKSKPSTLKDRMVDIFADLLVLLVTFVFSYQLTGRLSYGITITISIATV